MNLAEDQMLEWGPSADGLYLYAIQAGVSGPVKIGLTNDPARRLLDLQTANAEQLIGIAAWAALHFEEADVHDAFSHAHLRGEWFKPTPDLLAFVVGAGGGFPAW